MCSDLTYDKVEAVRFAHHYIKNGVRVVHVAFQEKAPRGREWQKRKVSEAEATKIWEKPNNIGILLGSPSGGLIDIDLDCEEAVELAPHFLPPSGAIHGRKSRPNSHWYYYCDAMERTHRFSDPLSKSSGETMLVECRGNGAQTVVPPSIHPSGEQIVWHTKGFNPPEVDEGTILSSVHKLAAACLLVRYWPTEGLRQECALALAGVLLRAGFTESEAEDFIDIVCTASSNHSETDPRESETRRTVVKYTKQNLDDGINVYGLPKLGELIGDKVASKVGEWLGLKKQAKFDSSNQYDAEKDSGSETPLVVIGGRIHRLPSNPNSKTPPKQICSFDAELIKVISDETGLEHLMVNLINGAHIKAITLPPDAWVSAEKFKKCLGGRHFNFTGTGEDVQYLRGYLARKHVEEIKGTVSAGFIESCFVTEEGCLMPDGTLSESIKYIGKRPTRSEIISTTPATSEELKHIAEHLPHFNHPSVAMPVLGWTFACFLKPYFMKRFGKFPLLNIEGQKESGKTSTLCDIIAPLWALNTSPTSISSCSRFTLMKAVSNSDAIPVIFDEHKASRMSGQNRNDISAMIRATYDANEGERGKQDQTTVIYKYSSPLVIAGESGFIEPALLDRFVFVHCSSEKSQPYYDHFDACRGLNLAGLGRIALEAALKMEEAEFQRLYDQEHEAVSDQLKNRPRHNAAVSRVGLCLVEQLLGIKLEKGVVDQSIISGVGIADGGERKSNADHILEFMGMMSSYKLENRGGINNSYNIKVFDLSQDTGLEHGVHYGIKDGMLRIRIQTSHALFKKAAKVYDFESDILDKSTFIKQLKDEPYYVENGSHPIASCKPPVHCFVLDIKKMLNKGLSLPPIWQQETFWLSDCI